MDDIGKSNNGLYESIRVSIRIDRVSSPEKQKSRRDGAPQVFHRVGLHINEPPRIAGLLFNESSGFVETRILNSQTTDAVDHTPFLRKRNPRFVIFWGARVITAFSLLPAICRDAMA
ncbi:MAG: hypothetical protein WCJ09_21245 [Planctomycetota bacterium]